MNLFRQTRKSQAHTAAIPTIRPLATRCAHIFLTALALGGAASWAQTNPTAGPSASGSGGYVGIGVNVAPRYQGSDESRTRAIPGFEYRWTNGLFVGGANGLVGAEIDATSELQLGLALGVDEGRKASRSRHLAGLGNIGVRATLNLYARAAVNDQFSLSTRLQMGAGNSGNGALLNVGASYGIPLTPAVRMSLNVGATVANSHYMQGYFGVSAAQAGASRYKRYSPGAGCRDVTVGLGLLHQISREWMLMASVDSTTLANEAKDSPLVRKATGRSVFASVAYGF